MANTQTDSARLPFLNGQDVPVEGTNIEIIRVRQVKSSKMEGYFVDVRDEHGEEKTVTMYHGSILEHQFMQQLSGIQFKVYPYPNKDKTRTYITTRKPEAEKSNSSVQQGRSNNGGNGGFRRR